MNEKFGRPLLIFFGICLGVILSELLVRSLEKKGVVKVDKSFIDDNRIFSSSMIYQRKPYSSQIFKLGDHQTYWGINQYGFRDGDYSLKKGKNTFRIVVLGDSITAGGGIDAYESYPKIMESRLNKEGPDTTVYEVLNMGVNGYGPINYSGLYINLAYQFSPDILIVGFYLGNDPGDSISYDLKQKEIFLTSLPDTLIPYSLNQFLKEHSDFWLFVLQKYYNWTQSYAVDTEKVMFAGDAKRHAFYDTHIEPSLFIKKGWELSKQAMVNLVNNAQKHGTKVIIVGLPTRSAVDASEWKRIKEDGHNVDKRLYDDPASEKMFALICTDANLECLPLRETLKKQENINELFLGKDNHFNYKGNQVVADTIINYLTSKNYINY